MPVKKAIEKCLVMHVHKAASLSEHCIFLLPSLFWRPASHRCLKFHIKAENKYVCNNLFVFFRSPLPLPSLWDGSIIFHTTERLNFFLISCLCSASDFCGEFWVLSLIALPLSPKISLLSIFQNKYETETMMEIICGAVWVRDERITNNLTCQVA